jgi:ribonucleoside-diphosphate reductase alpha chain
MTSHSSDPSVPAADIHQHEHNHDHDHDRGGNGNGGKASTPAASAAKPAGAAFTDTPPVVPAATAKSPFGLDLGPACQQCGGMMQRTGACYTCSSCGFNTGCG